MRSFLLPAILLTLGCNGGSVPDGTDAPGVDADCSAVVAADADVVFDDETVAGGAGDVVVCPEGDAVINGAVDRVFVLTEGDVVLNAPGAEVWVLGEGDITVNAEDVVVVRERAADVLRTVAPASETVCDAIVLDLSALPVGC